MLVLGIDFETTGLDLVVDEIIEVGAVLWDVERKLPLKIYSQLIQTKRPLSPEVSRLTGIHPQDLERWGVSEDLALTELVRLSESAEYIVSHNGNAFDRIFLEKALLRYAGLRMKVPWIDTLTDLPFNDTVATRKLTYLAAEHGFVNPFAHRAVFDVLTMLKIFAQYEIKDILELQASPTRRLVAGVSYEEREKAKNMGFRWDPSHRHWYLELKECQIKGRDFPFPVQVS